MCEKYNRLPTEVEACTFDQLYLLTAKEVDLATYGGSSQMSVEQARQAGVVKAVGTPGRMSLVQRVKAQKAEQQQVQTKMSKRERRRQYDEQLKQRRARGERV